MGDTSKRYRPEQIVAMLREAEVELAKGQSIMNVAKKLGITDQTYYRWRREFGGMKVDQANGKLRDKLLNGEVLCSLKEANVLIEMRRRHYNEVRPHSSLGYRPPAPAAWTPAAPGDP